MTPILLTLLALGAIPVVVSSDTGCEMDDQWAIAHLALSPAIELRAVVTAHAPGLTSAASAIAARAVFDRLPIARKPDVVAGSSAPLKDRSTPNRNLGVDRLLAESKGFGPDRRLTLVMIGPATDIASALLIDPSFADRVDIFAMAFEGWPGGGDPFNVRNDVAAWQVLMSSRVPIAVADTEVTARHLTLTRTEAKSKFAGTSAGAYLVSLQAGWLDRSPALAKRSTGSADAWPVFDEGAVAPLLGMAKVETHPRPTLRDDLTFGPGPTGATIRWVTAIDGDRLWVDFSERLRSAR